MNELETMNAFLGGGDLTKYREKYSRIKLVELDLDRGIQALRHLYREYWERRAQFPSYERFYEMYSSDLRRELEEFRREKMFSEETFYRGLPARIYRTWASLLTQIQGGYAAEEIYGRGNVEMNADLDYRGIDMRIRHGGEFVSIQIKKETMSREVRAPWQKLRQRERIVIITYEVPAGDIWTKAGELRKPFTDWRKKWERKLRRLDNGFIVFLPDMFAPEHIIVP